MDILEIIGVITGLLYLWFEWRVSIWLWVTGIIMPAIYIIVYLNAGLYADMALNIYYFSAAVYGWVIWLWGTKRETKLTISPTPRKIIFNLFILGLAIWSIVWFFLTTFTDSTVPIVDAFIAAGSIVAMWMLSRKYVEQWLVWLVVDMACTALYLYKGLYPTGILYGLYSIIALFGYHKWLKMYEETTTSNR